jgi:D-3-phosphoglycerate dehydrogenase/(S)-sulfolactate dehydrogenase
MTDIVVLEGVGGAAIDALAAEYELASVERLEDVRTPERVRGLIVRNRTRVDAALVARLPALEIVARAGAGLDNVDVQAASEAGVVVTYAPVENTESTAEHTLALALSAAHRVVELDAEVRAGGWDRRLGQELTGETWGVVGLGRIGRSVAALARGIGMRTVGFDPAVERAEAERLGVALLSLDELLGTALVVSLHVPLLPATQRLLGAPQLAAMRADAILVNTARGELVDEAALLAALDAGRPAAAALDVREHEPPVQPDPFAGRRQVILTPHVAGLSRQAQARVTDTIARDVRAVLAGGEAVSAANFSRPERRVG